MEFISIYGLFLAKTITIVLAIIVAVVALLIIAARSKEHNRLIVTKLNEKYEDMADTMHNEIQNKQSLKVLNKAKKNLKKELKTAAPKNKIFVLDFHGDIKASAVANLREEITAILLVAQPQDEVLVRIESPGGTVNGYGLAASQLRRIRDANIRLTAAVDKVAASGGYMMAAVADKIIAAPFSIVGSVGVVIQMPNFHRFLEKHNIDFEQITAGQYKRTLSLFGENTREGRKKVKEEADEMHDVFKTFVSQNRPQVDLEKIGTGEYWLAARAQHLALVDEIKTSDDFLMHAKNHYDLYEVHYKLKKTMGKRISIAMDSLLEYTGYVRT